MFLKLLKFMKGAGEVGQQYNTSDTPKLQTNNAIREDNYRLNRLNRTVLYLGK